MSVWKQQNDQGWLFAMGLIFTLSCKEKQRRLIIYFFIFIVQVCK